MLKRLRGGIARRAERWQVHIGYGLDRFGIGGLDNGPAWLGRNTLPETAIVCGSAPSLVQEFGETLGHRSGAFVIAVNQAVQLVRAQVLFTQHPEKASEFLAVSRNRKAEVHMGKYRRFARGTPVSVYWPNCAQGVTSGGSAIHVACMMGFSEVILCGLPMEGGSGYATGLDQGGEERRFGMEPSHSAYVIAYRSRFENFVAEHPVLLRPVRSCGGWTRRLFGAPIWQA